MNGIYLEGYKINDCGNMFLRNAWCKSCLYLSLTSTGIRSKITNGLITNMTAIKLPRTLHYASDYRLWLLWYYVLLHGSTPRQWRSRISVVVKALNAICSILWRFFFSKSNIYGVSVMQVAYSSCQILALWYQWDIIWMIFLVIEIKSVNQKRQTAFRLKMLQYRTALPASFLD